MVAVVLKGQRALGCHSAEPRLCFALPILGLPELMAHTEPLMAVVCPWANVLRVWQEVTMLAKAIGQPGQQGGV